MVNFIKLVLIVLLILHLLKGIIKSTNETVSKLIANTTFVTESINF